MALRYFRIFDVQVGRWCGRTWWLRAEEDVWRVPKSGKQAVQCEGTGQSWSLVAANSEAEARANQNLEKPISGDPLHPLFSLDEVMTEAGREVPEHCPTRRLESSRCAGKAAGNVAFPNLQLIKQHPPHSNCQKASHLTDTDFFCFPN